MSETDTDQTIAAGVYKFTTQQISLFSTIRTFSSTHYEVKRYDKTNSGTYIAVITTLGLLLLCILFIFSVVVYRRSHKLKTYSPQLHLTDSIDNLNDRISAEGPYFELLDKASASNQDLQSSTVTVL